MRLAAAALALAAVTLLVARWRLRAHLDAVCAPGAASPVAPRWLRRFGSACVRVGVFCQVGRITIAGGEHLARVPRPFVVAANHPHYADGPVMALVFDFSDHVYGLTARGALTWAGGLGAALLGAVRTVCVDLRHGHGTAAFRTGVRLLAEGKALLVFPEGWAHMDGHRGRFKTGAVAMAHQAAQRTGAAVFLLPALVHYPKHPGAWITRWPAAFQYIATLLAFPLFRRGVVVTFGAPIDARTLPADAHEATRVLERTIDGLASS